MVESKSISKRRMREGRRRTPRSRRTSESDELPEVVDALDAQVEGAVVEVQGALELVEVGGVGSEMIRWRPPRQRPRPVRRERHLRPPASMHATS